MEGLFPEFAGGEHHVTLRCFREGDWVCDTTVDIAKAETENSQFSCRARQLGRAATGKAL